MRVVVKHEGAVVQEVRLTKGPVYIGRHEHNQVILTNRLVSRQHAVLYADPEGHVTVEDLHSANGTFLNGKPVDKARVERGYVLRIAYYTIEIHPEGVPGASPAHLDDTMMPVPRQVQVIGRKVAADQGPDLVVPVHRVKEFVAAASAICQSNGPDETAGVLVDLLLGQFQAQGAWCGLRTGFEGPWTSQIGKTREGLDMTPHDLDLQTYMDRAVQLGQFLLLPQGLSGRTVRSAMIVPILEAGGTVGCLVAERGADQEPYDLRDLDYLIVVACHAGAVIENF